VFVSPVSGHTCLINAPASAHFLLIVNSDFIWWHASKTGVRSIGLRHPKPVGIFHSTSINEPCLLPRTAHCTWLKLHRSSRTPVNWCSFRHVRAYPHLRRNLALQPVLLKPVISAKTKVSLSREAPAVWFRYSVIARFIKCSAIMHTHFGAYLLSTWTVI